MHNARGPRRTLLPVVLLTVVLLTTACSDYSISISAAPTVIAAGETATLTVKPVYKNGGYQGPVEFSAKAGCGDFQPTRIIVPPLVAPPPGQFIGGPVTANCAETITAAIPFGLTTTASAFAFVTVMPARATSSAVANWPAGTPAPTITVSPDVTRTADGLRYRYRATSSGAGFQRIVMHLAQPCYPFGGTIVAPTPLWATPVPASGTSADIVFVVKDVFDLPKEATDAGFVVDCADASPGGVNEMTIMLQDPRHRLQLKVAGPA